MRMPLATLNSPSVSTMCNVRHGGFHGVRTSVFSFNAVKCVMGFTADRFKKQGELRTMVMGGIGERWAIDLCGPFCTSDGYQHIFTAIDCFSKYCIGVPIRNKSAATIAQVIVDHIFLKWGLCDEILTDQGTEFENVLLRELLQILGVAKVRTSGNQVRMEQ
jgi:transposase InsO family protein